MNVKDYDYDLPEELIAQDPLEDRSSSRLMVLDRQTGDVEHRHFTDILEYLHPGDCLVINNTKVIPARLFGVKEDTQAKIEVLLLKRKENDIWETLVKPGKKAKPGTKLVFGDGLLTAEVVDVVEEGNRLIQFHYEGIFEEILDQLGEMPLRQDREVKDGLVQPHHTIGTVGQALGQEDQCAFGDAVLLAVDGVDDLTVEVVRIVGVRAEIAEDLAAVLVDMGRRTLHGLVVPDALEAAGALRHAAVHPRDAAPDVLGQLIVSQMRRARCANKQMVVLSHNVLLM